MTVFSHGYTRPASSDSEEVFLLFTENLTLIRDSEERILETAEYFFCNLPFSSCSWPYVGGDGPLPLGYLLLGWKDGIFIEPCPDCHTECLTYSFAGSPLSGSNSWTGLCKNCSAVKYGKETVHKPFYNKLIFVTDLRKRYPQRIKRWQEVEGVKFSFGGDGLEPSTKKELRTIELFASIELADLIKEISNGIERPRSNPESGIEGDALGIKLSPR